MKIHILKDGAPVPGKAGETVNIVSIQPHILEMFRNFEKQGYIKIEGDQNLEYDPMLGYRSKDE